MMRSIAHPFVAVAKFDRRVSFCHKLSMELSLDDPSRVYELRSRIKGKASLRKLYEETYSKYADCLTRCPTQGIALELGSGAGFVKEVLPEIVTSDVIQYPDVDKVIDAQNMPFENNSLRAIFMLNVFHHIPDVAAFFREAERCLLPGGKILIVDQHLGWISKLVLKYVHHEPFNPRAEEWRFNTTGPLSGANSALAWIVFERDIEKFRESFSSLSLTRYEPHTPMRYWLAGGLKDWTLLPAPLFGAATILDRSLIKISKHWGSFVDIEIEKAIS
jgi:SAM-dependent methyltransferase